MKRDGEGGLQSPQKKASPTLVGGDKLTNESNSLTKEPLSYIIMVTELTTPLNNADQGETFVI